MPSCIRQAPICMQHHLSLFCPLPLPLALFPRIHLNWTGWPHSIVTWINEEVALLYTPESCSWSSMMATRPQLTVNAELALYNFCAIIYDNIVHLRCECELAWHVMYLFTCIHRHVCTVHIVHSSATVYRASPGTGAQTAIPKVVNWQKGHYVYIII